MARTAQIQTPQQCGRQASAGRELRCCRICRPCYTCRGLLSEGMWGRAQRCRLV
jgi:hypothetical protein